MPEVYKNPESLSQDLVKEDSKKSLDEWLEFLAKDEEDAIKGYNDAIDEIEDEGLKEQLRKILKEEDDHLEFLRKAKENHNLKYTDKGDK